MPIVPANASKAANGFVNNPPKQATKPPIHGPIIGIMFNTPVIVPNAAGLGICRIQNNKPDATPIIKHCKNVPLMYPAIT